MSGQPGSAINHGAFTRVKYAESRRNHRGQGFRGRKNTCGGKYLPTPSDDGSWLVFRHGFLHTLVTLESLVINRFEDILLWFYPGFTLDILRRETIMSVEYSIPAKLTMYRDNSSVPG
jgi:hypothetical protein